MLKQGDLFESYREGYATETVMAIEEFNGEGMCRSVTKTGEVVEVRAHEIGDVLINIEQVE